MDELIGGIQGEEPWCMLFTDDIIHIDETPRRVFTPSWNYGEIS